MSDGHLFEHSQITDLIYIGSDLCQGAVCPIHTHEFAKLGVCGEINLEIEHPETPPKNIDAYLWLPVVDGHSPTIDQLMIGTSMMQEMVSLGNKIYVHCRSGHGRSPTLVAAYFVRFEKKTVEQAIELVTQKRPEAHLEDVQLQTLKEFSLKWK